MTAADCFVLDCSVTMAWCFSDEASEATQALRRSLVSGREAIVPPIWSLEVVNVLLQAERKGRVSRAMTDRFVSLLGSLPIRPDRESTDSRMPALKDLARETGLSSYDAAYLDLAMRKAIPLATLDASLRSAAMKMGVSMAI